MKDGLVVVSVLATTLAGCHAIVGIDDPGGGGGAGAGATGSSTATSGGPQPSGTGTTSTQAGPGSGVTTGSGTGSSATGSPYADAVLADGPLLYFRFEEVTGDVIDTVTSLPKGAVFTYDGAHSTPGGSGTQRGVASPIAALGNAIAFAGSANGTRGGYVLHTSATNVAFDGMVPFTVELWASVSVANDALVTPVSNSKDTSEVSDGYVVLIGKDAGVDFATGIRSWAPTANGFSVAEVTGFDAGALHHYAFTYDGVTSRIYVDGQTAACGYDNCAYNGTLSPAVSAALTIGGAWTGVDGDPSNGSFVSGLIDEVAFYGRALSAAEIAAHLGAAGL